MILKPPVHAEDAKRKPSNDLAAKGGYPLAALERLLHDCDEQPDWRSRADICCSYYDGDQLTTEMITKMRAYNLAPRSVNLIGRVINAVLGQETKSRRDPVLEADDDDFADVADVLNVRLKEAQRETYADLAVSQAYASQVKAGVGWAHVCRRADPFQYPYLIEEVPRYEMWWDWRARRQDLRDARWVCRQQWKDLDEVIAWFPEHEQALRASANGFVNWLADGPIDEERVRTSVDSTTRWFRARRSEWVDGARERVKLYEVEYRVPATVAAMRVGPRWVALDMENPLHVAAVDRNIAPIKRLTTMQIRRALFAGPTRLSDEATKQASFSYVPFIAFRRDADNTPYGLIEGMIAPQDDYNESTARVRWMLQAQQLWIDDDALATEYNTVADITATMMRPDMVAVLNSGRRNANGMQFRNDFTLQRELFERMQDSKLMVQDVPGVYSSQLGNAPAGVGSGIAINSLIEQGIVAMGELNDNYLLGRRLVYEALVDLIVEDHSEADMQVTIGSGQARRTVALNTIDPQTGAALNNVKNAPVKVGLGEAPSSPAYQMQVSQTMGQMIAALAGTPHAAVLIPSWVEQTPMFGPGRKQLADDMRRVTGLPQSGDRASAQDWQQQQMAQAKLAQQAQEMAAQATAQKQQADAERAAAQARQSDSAAQLNMARAALIAAPRGAANDEDERIAAALREARG